MEYNFIIKVVQKLLVEYQAKVKIIFVSFLKMLVLMRRLCYYYYLKKKIYLFTIRVFLDDID